MQSKSKKIIALGLVSTALVGTIGNNLYVINSVAEDEGYINSDIDTLALAPNKPSIVMKDNVLTLVDNGVSSEIKDDFKSTSPFKYSNANWRTTGGVMRSEMITHDNSTENSFQVTAKEGDVLNITGSMSSEDYYDTGTILIDGEVVYEGYGARVPFNVNATLTAGKHTITFRYQKDSSGSEYEDCMLINSISLISKTNSKELKYRIDGGTWKTYTSKVTLDFDAKESYLIEAKAIGSDGKESGIVSRTVKRAEIELQAPEVISKKKGFLLKDNGVKTFSIRDTFDTANNISYSNSKWTTGSGKMISQAVGFGETTENKFTITADEGDILNIKGLINSDLKDEVGKIYLNDNLIYSSKATKGFNFEYELPEGTHEVKLEYRGTYGNQSVNSMVIDEINVATKLNSDKLQYRIDGGSWKDYTNPVQLDYKVKDSYVIETKSVYKNNSSSITKKTLAKSDSVMKAPTITYENDKLNIQDNGFVGTVAYDDFTFNSDFSYNNSDWTIKNNQFHSPVINNMWGSTLVEFYVDLNEMATLKLLGSQNSKDGSDYFNLYVDNLPVMSTSDNVLNVETDVYEGRHKIGLEFSKNSGIPYNYKGIIDLIEFEGRSSAKEILYKVDNGNWTKYTGEISIDFGNETTRKVYAKAVGADGTESAIVEQTITSDNDNTNPDPPTPPTDTVTKTENLEIAVKAKNTLEMSVSTNTINFGNYNGTEDFSNEDLNITVTSGLNYDLSATMLKDLTSERGDVMDSKLLNVKESTKKDFSIFNKIGEKLFLVQNSPAGRDNIHNIHFKLIGDSSVKAGNYTTTIQFEATQK